MITRQEFDKGAIAVRNNFMSALPKMIQVNVLNIASRKDLKMYVIAVSIKERSTNSRGSQNKRCDIQSFYSAMAVGTIIKVYEWGFQYLTPDGLYELATRVYNA